jgi:hypothetical protein
MGYQHTHEDFAVTLTIVTATPTSGFNKPTTVQAGRPTSNEIRDHNMLLLGLIAKST